MRIFDSKKKKELHLTELDLNQGRLFSDKLITTDENGDTKAEHILVYRHNGKGKIISEIGVLKEKLADTDYLAIKYAEGELSAQEYEETKRQRKAWRNRINELEIELDALRED